MSRSTALYACASLVLVSAIWYQPFLPAAAVLGALGAILALVVLPGDQKRPTPTVIKAIPAKKSGFTPGLGFGFSLFHWPPRPFIFLTLFRWRRR